MLGEQRGPVPSSVQQLFSGNYLGLYEKNLVMFEFVQPTLSLLYHLCTIVVERNSFFFLLLEHVYHYIKKEAERNSDVPNIFQVRCS